MEDKIHVLFVTWEQKWCEFETDNDRFIADNVWAAQCTAKDRSIVSEIIKRVRKDRDIDVIMIDSSLRYKIRDKYIKLADMLGELVKENVPPVFVIEWEQTGKDGVRNMNNYERSESLGEGIRGFISMPGNCLGEKEFLEGQKEAVNDVAYEMFLDEKLNKITSRGRSLEFDTDQVITSDGEVTILLNDFRLVNSMSADAATVTVKETNGKSLGFDDVIGADGAKEELGHFVRFLKDPKEFRRSGQQISKGILLYGPPGTGKTMLAKALAEETDCPFIATTGAQFVEGMLKGEKIDSDSQITSIHELFRIAKKYAPSIVFIDEIDAFALPRGEGESYRVLVNQLLTEMDGFSSSSSKPVFVIAATNSEAENKPYLDKALLRRFSKWAYIPYPDMKGRKKKFDALKSKYKDMDYNLNKISKEDIERLARQTAGSSLSEIETVIGMAVNRAADLQKKIDFDLITDCFDEFFFGEKKKTDEDHVRRIALHEAGHALLGFDGGKLHYPESATLVARAKYLGAVTPVDIEEGFNYTREDYLRKIRMSLAGRAAELVFVGEEKGLTDGASSDLYKATYYTNMMISKLGMEEGFLPVVPMDLIMQSPLAEKYLAKANEILNRELEYAKKIIEDKRAEMEQLADKLIERSRLESEEIWEVLYPGKPYPYNKEKQK